VNQRASHFSDFRDAEQKGESLLRALIDVGLPFALVMNCHNNGAADWSPAHPANVDMAKESAARLRNLGGRPVPVAGQQILLVNAAWGWVAGRNALDGEDEAIWAEDTKDDFEELAQSSRVDDLRRFIFAKPERSVGLNAYCLGALHRGVREWAGQARELIQQARSVFNHTT
jgi:hypothetical protein